MSIYDYSECDEIADSMIAAGIIAPKRRLSFDEALTIVRAQMPDESHTIISNVAEALVISRRGEGSGR